MYTSLKRIVLSKTTKSVRMSLLDIKYSDTVLVDLYSECNNDRLRFRYFPNLF